MSFATRNRFAVSTIARLCGLYGLLLVIAFSVMGAAIWVITNAMTTYELRGPLLMEAAFVREVIATEGLAHAMSDIDLRTEHRAILLHRLSDETGALLAGDGALPHLAPGWTEVTSPVGANGSNARVFVYTDDVGAGARLSVGIDLTWPNSVRDATLRILALAGVVIMALALAIGVVSTNGTYTRMRELWHGLRAAGDGDFAARVAVRNSRRPDDIDALAIRFNELMDHTVRLMASVQRVSANIAHDLRTPLSHLDQRLDKAANAATLDEARAELANARCKIDEILRLFDSMLHLTELQTGRLRTSFQLIDLAPLTERLLDAYRAQMEERGVQIEGQIEGDARILGDEALVARALSNVLENAERHAPQGKRVRVALRTGEDHVALSISDEGAGLSQSETARALEPFERLDQSRAAPGYGLGLPIVAAIVALHDGRLFFEDAGPGLRVTMSFPRR